MSSHPAIDLPSSIYLEMSLVERMEICTVVKRELLYLEWQRHVAPSSLLRLHGRAIAVFTNGTK